MPLKKITSRFSDSIRYMNYFHIVNYATFLTTRKAAWFIILVDSVCQTITFESLDIASSYLHIQYISMQYGVRFVYEGHRVKVKAVSYTHLTLPTILRV